MADVLTRTCAIDGCERHGNRRGWCAAHYMRWWRFGDPLADYPPRRQRPPCSVEGCDRKHQGRGLCAMHLERIKQHGHIGPTGRVIADPGDGSVMANGYRVLNRPSHPLAGAQHKVYEHRVVLYDVLGPGTHPCHWCSTPLRWEARWPDDLDALTVDHLDDDTLNNDPANLVPSCNECNTQRSRRTHR